MRDHPITGATVLLWPAKWGWHWHVNLHREGMRPDPGVPEAYPWALTRAAAMRRARRQVGRSMGDEVVLAVEEGRP